MVRTGLGALAAILVVVSTPTDANAAGCTEPGADWLACEDFEQGGLGWQDWFAQSPFVECLGCSPQANNPDRVVLDNDPANAFEGDWSLYLPADANAQYQGAELSYRSCIGDKSQGCPLQNYDRLHFRARVKLAEDHEYMSHFLSISGTRPDAFWEAVGNAGCRPNGYRHMGTTVDFNRDNELFFYTYHPGMNCDAGGYCSGDYAQGICDGCANRDMPCTNGLECCWGNLFRPDPPVILPRGEWVCLEMMIEANTPGESDGVMAFWIDDQLAVQVDNMYWRDVPELGLNRANLGQFLSDPDRSNRLWFDDFVVSTERIGCAMSPGPGGSDGGDAGDSSGEGGLPPMTSGPGGGGADGSVDSVGGAGSPSTAGGTGGAATTGDGAGAAGDESGCGCRQGGRGAGWPGALLLGLLVARLRRRRAA